MCPSSSPSDPDGKATSQRPTAQRLSHELMPRPDPTRPDVRPDADSRAASRAVVAAQVDAAAPAADRADPDAQADPSPPPPEPPQPSLLLPSAICEHVARAGCPRLTRDFCADPRARRLACCSCSCSLMERVRVSCHVGRCVPRLPSYSVSPVYCIRIDKRACLCSSVWRFPGGAKFGASN